MLQRSIFIGILLITAWAPAALGNAPATLPPPFDRASWAAPAPQWQSGDQYWANQFSLPQVDGIVRCVIQHQGKLVVGGSFHQIGDVPAANIAVWDGTTWSELGGGTDGPVNALLSYQGDLIVGGEFQQAGSRQATCVVRWNGAGWEPLGMGLWDTIPIYDPDYYYYYEPPAVRTLAVYQGALVAGGSFARTGPFSLPALARWNGSTWLPMASYIDGPVHALTVSGDTLYAGGLFRSVDSQSTGAVALWDGQRWSGLGAGFSMPPGYGRADVRTLLPFDGRVFAGGVLGPSAGTGLAAWNGASWDTVGTLTYGVQSLAARDDTLFVGGDYGLTTVPGDTFAIPSLGGSVYGMTWYGSFLVAVGSVEAHDQATDSLLAMSMAIRGTSRWYGLIPWTDQMRGLGGGIYSQVTALGVYRDQLLALGEFRFSGDPPRWNPVRGIAAWDGASWRQFPQFTGLCGYSYRGPLLSDVDTLYLAGDFYRCGTPGHVPVVRYDGETWSPLDSLPLLVNAMTMYGGSLHIAGERFDLGSHQSEVYRLAGGHWVRVGFAAGYQGTSIQAMTVYNGRLIVGGRFEGMSNLLASSVAAWDGSHWQAIGTIPHYYSEGVASLAVYRGTLVASVYQGSGRSVSSWDGATWEPLGSLTALGVDLAAIGGELYLGGYVQSNRLPYTDGVARWNGRAWEPLGSGTNGPVRALQEWRGSLWLGGNFTRAGSHASFAIARWDGVRATLGAPRVALAPGVPNPFRVATAIRYRMRAAGDVHVSVTDVRGRSVRILERTWKEAGDHAVSWDGRDDNGRPAASGVYYVQILLLDGTKTSQKVVLLR